MLWQPSSYITNVFGEEDGWKSAGKVVGAICGSIAIGYGTYKLYQHLTKSRKDQYLAKSRKEVESDSEDSSRNDTVEESLELALLCKQNGNKMFCASKYEEAKKLYTDAILRCPADQELTLAVFFQNRAAASAALKQWEAVVADCNEAIDRDDRYQKAYSRRGKAKLALRRHEEAILDAASGYYLQSPKKTKETLKVYVEAISETSRVKRAQLIVARTAPLDFGIEALRVYIMSSSCDGVLGNLDSLAKVEGEQRTHFHNACAKMLKPAPSMEIVALLELELKRSHSPVFAQTLLLKGAVLSLGGCPLQAEKTFDDMLGMDSLEPRLQSSAYLRRSLLKIASGSDQAMGDFTEAERADPTNPDVYHQRAQIAMLLGNVPRAQMDFNQAVELHKQQMGEVNPVVLVHKLAYDLETGQSHPGQIVKEMEGLCKRHPSEAEVWLIYCQALMCFGKFPEADKAYEQCLQSCADNPRIYIQRAGFVRTWKKDTKKAIDYLNVAKSIDPSYDAVYDKLGSILMEEGRYEEALEMFQFQLKYARASTEIEKAYTMTLSIEGQLHATEKFGLENVENVFQVKKAMLK